MKTVAERRLPEIRKFLISLFLSADEIAHSDLVYTFFHPILRDQQEADITVPKIKGNFSRNIVFLVTYFDVPINGRTRNTQNFVSIVAFREF